METPPLPNETFVKDGAANLQRGIETVGGKLYLTNQRLVFESHALNIQTGTTIIPLSSINRTRKCWTKFLNIFPVFPNSIAVSTKEGKEYRFVAFGRQDWIDAIGAAVGASTLPPTPDKNISGERVLIVEVSKEIDRFFDDSSIPAGGQSEFVLIVGTVCTGKTTLRRQLFSKGYVLIDAGEIFLSLSKGEYFEFGAAFEEPMELIGSMVAKRAIEQRRNIVTEMIGDEGTNAVFDAMTAINYKVQLKYLQCDMEEAYRRNLNRGDDSISAAYTQAYHQRWILNAVKEIA
jgi:GRAM domain-containing protein/AAA domain-containing protein